MGFAFDEGPARRVWAVGALVEQVRVLVERQYLDVWVEGEISNLRPASSGHVYFTLKDAEAQLPVVLFRRQAMLLRFRPEDGLHVLVRGRASVYAQRGQLQLVAETMEPVGAGSLQLAFEQLRDRLKAEGLFEAERKRTLPAFPRTVAIVTSPTGAVIRDFLNVAGRRHEGLNVLLYPVAVQGEGAAAEIEEALKALDRAGVADVIVVARGGGSLEDLAAFNSERVARAIAASRVPVVSAVGHETDFTIADFVADLRAPTPSAAAELITEAHYGVHARLGQDETRLERAVRYALLQARQRVDSLHAERAEWHVSSTLERLGQRLDDAQARLEDALAEQMREREETVAELATEVLRHDPRRLLAAARERLAVAHHGLERACERVTRDARVRLHEADVRLKALSPLAVLERGYALVQNERGEVVRSAAQLSAGDRVTTRLHDGAFTSRVEEAAAGAEKKRTRKK